MEVAVTQRDHRIAGRGRGIIVVHDVVGFEAGRRIVIYTDLFRHHCIRIVKLFATRSNCPSKAEIEAAAFDRSWDDVKIPILTEAALLNKLNMQAVK